MEYSVKGLRFIYSTFQFITDPPSFACVRAWGGCGGGWVELFEEWMWVNALMWVSGGGGRSREMSMSCLDDYWLYLWLRALERSASGSKTSPNACRGSNPLATPDG